MNKTHSLSSEVREEFFISGNLQAQYMSMEIVVCRGSYREGAKTIPSYGRLYPYKGAQNLQTEREGQTPPPTTHLMSGQSGGGAAHYRLVGSM